MEELIKQVWEWRDMSRWSDDKAVRVEYDGEEFTVGIVFDATLDCCHDVWHGDMKGEGPTLEAAVADLKAKLGR